MADSFSARPFKGKWRVWNATANRWWSTIRHRTLHGALGEVDKFVKQGFSS